MTIDPVKVGELIQAVRDLKEEQQKLRDDVEQLTALTNRGKGYIGGMMLAAAGVGAFISEFLKHFK